MSFDVSKYRTFNISFHPMSNAFCPPYKPSGIPVFFMLMLHLFSLVSTQKNLVGLIFRLSVSCRSRFTVILNSTCWISTHSYVPSIPWADNGVIFSTILTYACMAMVTPEVRAQIFVECVKWPFCRLTVSCRPTVEVTASPARKVRSIAGTSNKSVPWSLCVRITYE